MPYHKITGNGSEALVNSKIFCYHSAVDIMHFVIILTKNLAPLLPTPGAQVAELVDALASGASDH